MQPEREGMNGEINGHPFLDDLLRGVLKPNWEEPEPKLVQIPENKERNPAFLYKSEDDAVTLSGDFIHSVAHRWFSVRFYSLLYGN